MITMSPECMEGCMETPSALLIDMTWRSMVQYVAITGITRRQLRKFLNIITQMQLYCSIIGFDQQATVNRVPLIIDIFMFPTIFWIKYLFRVMHIGSLVVICQSVLTAKLIGQGSSSHPVLYMMAGILVIVSGLVNIFLLNAKEMGEKRKPWVAYHHLKLLTAVILFSPLVKALPISPQNKIDMQFYWIVLSLICSPFARFYRQFFAGKEKERRGKQLQEQDTTA